ncbi:4-hydroxybenzoate polyprenyltransferase [Phycisphaerales bacterium]|nr:4-hydroxybenzoate polyprenyltransferase [Phycisphaerales bacterium]
MTSAPGAPVAATPSPTPSPRAGIVGALFAIASDIKLAHSVFALPFAILAAFLARPLPAPDATSSGWARFAGQLALVVACMVLARTWAMLINRIVDRRLDAENQRTKARVFAAGAASPILGWALAALCALLFVAAASLFRVFYQNSWPLYLAIPLLAWLALYSWTKRFTALCHLVLGISLAISPIAAALAINPPALLQTPTLWWMAGFIALWVGGFDVIYSLQDEDFDRAKGLFSIPTRFGTAGAINTARSAHAAAFVALLASWTSDPRLGWLYGAGVACVAALLITEHTLLTRSARGEGAKPRLHMVFFTLNGVVSLIIGAAGCIDVLN